LIYIKKSMQRPGSTHFSFGTMAGAAIPRQPASPATPNFNSFAVVSLTSRAQAYDFA
jgi:hypothetical protein